MKRDLMKVYISHIRSIMDYAAAGWQPWLRQSNMDALEIVQNKAIRIVTGNVQKSRISARRWEALTPSYSTLSKRNILRSVEKAVRLDDQHPRKLALCKDPVPRKNTRLSWRFARLVNSILHPPLTTGYRLRTTPEHLGTHPKTSPI
jgi:hypothetical protein